MFATCQIVSRGFMRHWKYGERAALKWSRQRNEGKIASRRVGRGTQIGSELGTETDHDPVHNDSSICTVNV